MRLLDGGGTPGSLYDCAPQFCESLDSAIDGLDCVYELTEEEKETLRTDMILYFDNSKDSLDDYGCTRAQSVGAQYCEISESDGPCPEEDK